MIKLLVTGSDGQLGSELRRLLKGDGRFSAQFTDIGELDITDREAVYLAVDQWQPKYIINCAAYTAVDLAEERTTLAYELNCRAVSTLAQAASRVGARIVHISTDYVFDGKANTPYREDDKPNPTTAYGRTKLGGEQALAQLLPLQAVVLRTSWLYSAHGKSFVKTMLELGRTRQSLRVVYDQVGSPTLARDLARAVLTVVTAPEWRPGIYHYSNEGAVSWYDFAKAIHRLAGITGCDIQPCLSDEFPTAARRPAYSVLDKSKFKATFGAIIPHWEESLRQFFGTAPCPDTPSSINNQQADA